MEMQSFISLKKMCLLGLSPLLAVLLFASCSSDDAAPPRNLDRRAAIEEATKAIVPLVVQPGDEYVCVMMDTILAKGTVIEEDAPATAGASRSWDRPGASRTEARVSADATGARGRAAASPSSTTLSEDSYFFYLDRSPNTFYAHDVAYIVIGKSSNYQVIHAQWWPRINGRTYAPFMKAIPRHPVRRLEPRRPRSSRGKRDAVRTAQSRLSR